MAYWANWSSAFNYAFNNYKSVLDGANIASTQVATANTFWLAADYPNAILWLIKTVETLIWQDRFLTTAPPTLADDFASLYCTYLDHQAITEPEVTMSAIIDSMLTASADEVQWFVGITDAYRQSIWNKPFDKEFYTALARGFELWA